MRTQQRKRFETVLMNKPMCENIRPESGIARKKRKNWTHRVKPHRLHPKLQRVALRTIDAPSDEVSYAIDQIHVERTKTHARGSTAYGYQLEQRKKFRWFYGGVSTRYVQALLRTTSSDSEVFQTLERRLDVSLYRGAFFQTVDTARQWILHRRVFVNGKVAIRPSHALRPGDIVTIHPKWHTVLKRDMFERCVKFFARRSHAHSREGLGRGNAYLTRETYPNLRSVFLTKPLQTYTDTTVAWDARRVEDVHGRGLRHENTARTYVKLFHNSKVYDPISPCKPVHLEISYEIFTMVYLYVPQKMSFPSLLDIAAIRKSL